MTAAPNIDKESNVTILEDKEYLYHYTTLESYKNWKDDFFRGKLWNPKNSYPHRLLKAQQNSLKNSEVQFIICFYSSYEIAAKSRVRDFFHCDTHLLRVAKKHLIESGFNQSLDDGFDEGEVYLFWLVDKISTNLEGRSEKGVSIDKVQVQYDNQWLSVTEHRKCQTFIMPIAEKKNSAKYYLNRLIRRILNWFVNLIN